MNGPAEATRQPKFSRALERAGQTHKHTRSVVDLAERLTAELVGSAPQPPGPTIEGERAVPGNVADQLDDLILSIDRCVDRIEMHLIRLAGEMVPGVPGAEPSRPAAFAR